MILEQSIKEHFSQASKNADIARAAEKLVKCKGRYHAELNYKALAELFGVTVPTVELESKWVKCSDRMPDDEIDVVIINKHGDHIAGFVNVQYLDTHDGTGINMNQAIYWIPLPPHPTE
ncbi:DUF551 domain-containing protein [Rosenbergiella collisarenosi]|uniref:DUF551 domain-containing protein n=1 Tax=Rosenbergiella collisarenosi TaxID=1544695 RepID=UPI001BD9B500|nr:DUF551 domain-containing protein [Rosenbergiella collisarenosi]MBT0720412.1 DUF551 domain-containing protein [Rosenbergiella collisarenosi]